MGVINELFSVNTSGFTDIINITKKVESIISLHLVKNASVVVSVKGRTASIATMEYEAELIKDVSKTLNKLVPSGASYLHDKTWDNQNGHAHILATIVGNSVTIPVINGVLFLGDWQQIVLIDFDNKDRTRTICVQIIN